MSNMPKDIYANELYDILAESYKIMVETYVHMDGHILNFLENTDSLYPEEKDEIYDTFLAENMRILLNNNGIYAILQEAKLVDKVVHTDKKISDKIDNFVSKAGSVVKKLTLGNSRDNIVENRIKASRVLKEFTAYSVISAIATPYIALLAWLTKSVIKYKMTKKEKEKLLFELKTDLEVIEEKIKDADSNNDAKKKYELMRIRNEMRKTLETIRKSPVITPIS